MLNFSTHSQNFAFFAWAKNVKFPFSRYRIQGHSMEPTLKPGQMVWVWHWFVKPKPGDVVVFKHAGKSFVKRVEKISGAQAFLVGDNLQDSLDSRQLGAVNLTDIIGRVI